jgi:molecular chaperone DnaK (HSP70)
MPNVYPNNLLPAVAVCSLKGMYRSGVYLCLPLQAKKTKEVLSANTDAPISVEELHNGSDFRSRITRQVAQQLSACQYCECMRAL